MSRGLGRCAPSLRPPGRRLPVVFALTLTPENDLAVRSDTPGRWKSAYAPVSESGDERLC
jgi:hypothetical protein